LALAGAEATAAIVLGLLVVIARASFAAFEGGLSWFTPRGLR